MINEQEFIQDLRNKRKQDKAFAKLLDLYQERLYWHIRKIVGTHENADDVLQNTFIRVYRSLGNFKQQSSLHTWMYRIAYNESIRFLESQKKRKYPSMNEVNEQYLEDLRADVFFDGDEAQLLLQRVLLELPEKQRIVFQMKYFDDLKFKEVAAITNIHESTVKTSYYAAVKYIENHITSVDFRQRINELLVNKE